MGVDEHDAGQDQCHRRQHAAQRKRAMGVAAQQRHGDGNQAHDQRGHGHAYPLHGRGNQGKVHHIARQGQPDQMPDIGRLQPGQQPGGPRQKNA